MTAPGEELAVVRPDIHSRRLRWAWVMAGASLLVSAIAIVAQALGLGVLAIALGGLGVFSGARVIAAAGQSAWRRFTAGLAMMVALFGVYVGWALHDIAVHGIEF